MSLVIENNGPDIVRTNYWQLEHGRCGLLYLSVNAGAIRLLVPPRAPTDLLTAARLATRARVQVAGPRATDGVHVVLDDDSDAPYALTLDVRQCDRTLPLSEVGRWVPLRLVTIGETGGDSARVAHELPALIDRASTAPDRSPVPQP